MVVGRDIWRNGARERGNGSKRPRGREKGKVEEWGEERE